MKNMVIEMNSVDELADRLDTIRQQISKIEISWGSLPECI